MNDNSNTSNPTQEAVAAQNAQAATATGNDVAAAAGASDTTKEQEHSSAGPVAGSSAEDQVKDAESYTLQYEANDTAPDRELLNLLKGYRHAAEIRFKHLLTGMANSTAEVLRCMADVETHLADHIAQQETANS